ncbi:unnamed protein product, partial [Coregonus sp. 'balchen']
LFSIHPNYWRTDNAYLRLRYATTTTFTSSKGTRHNNNKMKHVNSLQRTFCTASVKQNCWNCGQSVESVFVSDFLLLFQLELKGMYIEEGMDTGANPMFLMEINEALDEEQSKEELDKIGASMKDKLKDLTEQIDASLHKGEFQAAKALFAQMKYFANIEDKVKERLSVL